MKEIICGEIFKSKKNKSYKIIYWVAICLVTFYCIYLNLYMKIDKCEILFSCYLGIVDYMFPIMALFCLNFFEEYRENTLKNMTVMRSRKEIFNGKVLFQIMESVVIYLSVIIVFVIYSLIMIKDHVDMFTVKAYIAGLVFGLFLIIRNVLFTDVLIMIIKNEVLIVIAYVLITNYADSILKFITNGDGSIGVWLFPKQVIYLKMFDFSQGDYIVNLTACLIMVIVNMVLGRSVFCKSSI